VYGTFGGDEATIKQGFKRGKLQGKIGSGVMKSAGGMFQKSKCFVALCGVYLNTYKGRNEKVPRSLWGESRGSVGALAMGLWKGISSTRSGWKGCRGVRADMWDRNRTVIMEWKRQVG